MASDNRRSSGSRKNGSGRKKSNNRSSSGNRRNSQNTRKRFEEEQLDESVKDEIYLIVLLAVCVLLFFCIIGIGGKVGSVVRNTMFGLIGFISYAAPAIVFITASFCVSNQGNRAAMRKFISAMVLCLIFSVFCDLITGSLSKGSSFDIIELYKRCSEGRNGGGVLGGTAAWLLVQLTGMAGAVFISIIGAAVCVLLISGKAIFHAMARKGREFKERAALREDDDQYYDDEYDEEDAEDEEEESRLRRQRIEEFENRRRLQREDRVRNAAIAREERERNAARAREEHERNIMLAKEEKKQKIENEDNANILGRDYSTPDSTSGTVKRAASANVISSADGISSDSSLFSKDHDGIHEIIFDDTEDDTNIDVSGFDNDLDNSSDIKDAGEADRGSAGADFDLNEDDAKDYDKQEPLSSDVINPIINTATETAAASAAGAGNVVLHKDGVTIGSDAVRYGTNGNIIPGEEGKMPMGSFGAGDTNGDQGTKHTAQIRPSAAAFAGGSASTAGTDSTAMGKTDKEPAGTESAKPKTAKAVPAKAKPRPYVFPPLGILTKGVKSQNDNSGELRATAQKLETTLKTFGVNARVTDVSQGPAVTRYELHPESGVKVSKIVGLSDDIKLNLAATDIRIEAPIPGKAAVGIEVPNKENSMVALRDLLELKAFKEFPSKLAFAVGKDIGGQIVVSDVAKMPHMLIAGATGSGKSVCINTIIMSILYKARPDEVKLIMIDPKVVELSVYNGIPHLIVPVVTDPKKASGALQWGVAEMTDRYQKFADMNVRDLKGYNKKVESMKESGDDEAPAKLPQIVIIVDELADLMMVSPGEVEESICRLAQLARAAGIHLIIATQRPSVDVITGLIKANMPSRVAFAVSSGVDSRTILDMNGAEKLLGKGDMLFYPQGYPKPARIQGAFVSDKEVQDVVNFIKKNTGGEVYDENVENKIKSLEKSSGNGKQGQSQGSQSDDQGPDVDQLFRDAAELIIDKDKASIGMLQRVFKIGFNRAARIMDQLAQNGVVSEEDGTKPRNVLMSKEAFDQFMDQMNSDSE